MKQEITCPQCRSVLEVDSNASSTGWNVCIVLSVLLLAASIFGIHQMLRANTLRHSLNDNLQNYETRSNLVSKTEKQLVEAKKKLDERAKDLLLKQDNRLQEKYPSLKRCDNPRVEMAHKHVSYVAWDPSGKIRVVIENKGSTDIDGKFTVYFLNSEGFVTAQHHDDWSWTKVRSGETRISDSSLRFRFGQPVYCFVETE